MAKKWPPLFSLPPPYFIHTALRVHRRPLRLPGMFHRPINFDPLPRKLLLFEPYFPLCFSIAIASYDLNFHSKRQ